MDWKIFLTVFAAVFIAELGDKTQLATMLFAADKEVSKLTVFFAASCALVVASAIGVLAGSVMRTISTRSTCTLLPAPVLSSSDSGYCSRPEWKR
jgi:putative Ca2+/H+ antiporter (TMEM165/GDT1 family)